MVRAWFWFVTYASFLGRLPFFRQKYNCAKLQLYRTFSIWFSMAGGSLRCTVAFRLRSGDLDGSLLAPTVDKALSSVDRLAAVKSVLEETDHGRTVTVFDAKEQYKLFSRCCGIALCFQCMDPKVACWLLDPAAAEKNLHCLVTNYCPLETGLLQGLMSLSLSLPFPCSDRIW